MDFFISLYRGVGGGSGQWRYFLIFKFTVKSCPDGFRKKLMCNFVTPWSSLHSEFFKKCMNIFFYILNYAGRSLVTRLHFFEEIYKARAVFHEVGNSK